MLVVTTPAPDRNIMTASQMRAAAGIPDNDTSQDAALLLLNARISAEIYDACNIAVGNGAEPTLRQETLTETVTALSGWPLILSRRHNIEVTSITGWAGISDPAQYLVENEAGLIRRAEEVFTGIPARSSVVVVYKAGFATVPPVLVGAATDLIRVRQSEVIRDPLVKKTVVDVDGIDRVETEFWVTAAGTTASSTPVPPQILAALRRFRNAVAK